MPDSPPAQAVRVEAVILTLDESGMIERCIDALAWCDRVHVVDSGSTDGTVALARAAGAVVREHAFESFGRQRNWALDHCGLRADWVLFIDADEIATESFAAAALGACEAASTEIAGFYLCGRLMMGERWLRRSAGFPTWQFRLARRGRCRFTDFGHGQKEGEIDGRLEYLAEPYLHHAYYKGWRDWFDKHVGYAAREAEARDAGAGGDGPWSEVFARDASRRNVAIKRRASGFAPWPLVRFAVTYLVRGGFLDGRAGLVYAINMAWYEYLIILMLRERRRRRGARVGDAGR